MAAHFRQVLEVAVSEPQAAMKDMGLLSEAERQQILFDFNATTADYPQDNTIHGLFEAQVERTPDNIAVVFEEQQLTYRELNARANQLARVLREKGVQPDSLVGIMVERSLEMIVGIMAILKAGGAYVPLDPEFPKERIQYMLADSGSKLLLIQPHLDKQADFALLIDTQVITLKDELFETEEDSNMLAISKSHHLAYVIYTSGSTGLPKGVMVEHHSVVNYLRALQYHYPLNEVDVLLQKSLFSFDASVREIFWWISVGASVQLLAPNGEKDPKEIIRAIEDGAVTVLHFIPSMLQVFLDYVEQKSYQLSLQSLRRVFSGGERLTASLAKRFEKLIGVPYNVELTNSYGPTEATVVTSYFDIKDDNIFDTVPIGRPIDSAKVYIVNRYNQLQPVGVVGELCIGGAGLARGYLNRQELAAEKFVANPFHPGERMYRSGDLVRWLPDGNIEFLGRIDQQVKIRGYRIELGEIEAQLLGMEAVKEAVVIAHPNEQGEHELCAYVVAEEDLTVAELRGGLSLALPSYMVPSYYVQLEQLPLTPNGKLDRKALPAPEGQLATGVAYVAPRSELEQAVASIWQDVLGVTQVGVHDNFFELGGHSLRAMTLLSRLHRELGVELKLGELFRHPTLEAMAAAAGSGERTAYAAIRPVAEQPYYAVSSAQKRMYVLSQLEGAELSYNMPIVLQLEGQVDRGRVEQALNSLIARHESLRTSFEMNDGEVVQIIHPALAFAVSERQAAEAEAAQVVEAFIRPFDLQVAPLLRVELVQMAPERHLLLIDMHHIIADGVSLGVMVEEFTKLYAGEELPALRIQYKDYAAWQQERQGSEAMKEHESYWLETLAGEVPTLQLPTDYPRPAVRSFEGARVGFTLDETLAGRLRDMAEETGTTLYMVLLAAYKVLLSKYTGQEEVIVGSPIAGRPHADVEKLMGVFVNTLALRSYPTGEKTFASFLQEVKEQTLSAFEHQEYPFEELVGQLELTRDLSRHPLFDTMFILQNTERGVLELPGLRIAPYERDHRAAKFDLTLQAAERENEIDISMEYSTALFKAETIQRMAAHFRQVLQTAVDDPHRAVREMELLSHAEKHQILFDFNATTSDYPEDNTIHGLFEAQAERTPDNIAVVFEEQQLTYRELNERANQLARVLRDKGVQADSLVGLMVERSLEMIVGMLAILKAG
ncbi:amino acid adenylation domain-containing protein, partial [Paenibacillus glycinis]